MSEILLTPKELAARWKMGTRGLDRWRYTGLGPRFVKLGHKTVRYRLADVEQWERNRTQSSTIG